MIYQPYTWWDLGINGTILKPELTKLERMKRCTLLASPHMRMDTMMLPQDRQPQRRALAAAMTGSTSIDCRGGRKGWRRFVPTQLNPPVIPHHPPPPPPLKRMSVQLFRGGGGGMCLFDWICSVPYSFMWIWSLGLQEQLKHKHGVFCKMV
jgi:hypothetical protein